MRPTGSTHQTAYPAGVLSRMVSDMAQEVKRVAGTKYVYTQHWELVVTNSGALLRVHAVAHNGLKGRDQRHVTRQMAL